MIKDFNKLKNTFFTEVKLFKVEVLDLFENVVESPTDGSKTSTVQVYFLWKQVKSKDETINSLLN